MTPASPLPAAVRRDINSAVSYNTVRPCREDAEHRGLTNAGPITDLPLECPTELGWVKISATTMSMNGECGDIHTVNTPIRSAHVSSMRANIQTNLSPPSLDTGSSWGRDVCKPLINRGVKSRPIRSEFSLF